MSHTHQQRRTFLQTGAVGFFTAVFASLPKINFAGPTSKDKGIVVHESEGEHLLTGRRKAPVTIKISKTKNDINNISFCTEDIISNDRIRIHKHLNEDEFVFIHKGEGIFILDDQRIEVKSGAIVFVPRGTWHGLENIGKETLCMVFGYSPSGFEGYFRENGTLMGMPAKTKTAEEYATTEKKYGIVFKDKL
jgi:mannose-6-phosphate isomerase-like protein (cupin superfamily)